MPSRALSLATFRLWTQYFRYETEGFDILASAEPSLIVAYHGGPWTFDLWMLAVRMHDELGYFPGAVWHPFWWRIPAFRQVVTGLGGLPGLPTALDVAGMRSRGEHFVVAPGGTREGLRPFWRSRRVDFGRRRGYLRLAQAHDLPIIPVAASGLDDMFIGLNNGPAWVALGLGGVWPLALPFPVKVRQRIGEPISVGSLPLEVAHVRVTETLQSLLDDLA
jgi:1-acyl-sn-glycerol-3-phosphate acyltransferase